MYPLFRCSLFKSLLYMVETINNDLFKSDIQMVMLKMVLETIEKPAILIQFSNGKNKMASKIFYQTSLTFFNGQTFNHLNNRTRQVFDNADYFLIVVCVFQVS